MIGQDLAFDEEGNSHSKGFDFGEKFSGEENIDKLKVTAYAGKGEVLTHITWNDYRIKLEYLFACNEQKAKFYNATEGGARINFTEELSFKECCEKLLTKEKPQFELPKSLTKNRSDKLLVKFKEKIQKDQDNAKRFLDDALALKPPPRVLFKISKLSLKPCPVILLGIGKSSQASSYIAFPVWLKSWLLKSSLSTISLFNFFKNAK